MACWKSRRLPFYRVETPPPARVGLTVTGFWRLGGIFPVADKRVSRDLVLQRYQGTLPKEWEARLRSYFWCLATSGWRIHETNFFANYFHQ